MTIQAVLAFDSDAANESLGTRGFAAVQTRSLLFQGSGLSVDLLLQDAGPMQVMHGQVVQIQSGNPAHDVRVALGDRKAAADPYGQFTMSVMDEHRNRLHVRSGDVEMICEIPRR